MGKTITIVLGLMILCAAEIRAEERCREFEGLIEPSERVELSSQVPGVLAEVLVERGDWVAKGQVLARLSSGVEAAVIELSKAKLDFDRRKSLRNEELFRDQLISTHEKDELETEIRLAELELRAAEERLNLRTIASPIDGVVVEKILSPGEYINDGAVLRIAAIDPLYVEVVIPVECYGEIRNGVKALVIPEQPVGGTYESIVRIADQVIDAASGTFGVRLELANRDRILPAGLNCRVRFSGN